MKMPYAFVRMIATGLALAAAWSFGSAIAGGMGGVAAVAPRFEDVGRGCTERQIVFAMDPLDQSPETVNEAASRNPPDGSRLLTQVRAGMEAEGALGMGSFAYGFGNLVHGQGRYDLYLSRFPDPVSVDQQWGKYATQSDQADGPEIGAQAIWLPRSAADHDHRLVFRKGLYIARLECTATQEPERLIYLARMVVNTMTGTSETDGAANGRQPIRTETKGSPGAAESRR